MRSTTLLRAALLPAFVCAVLRAESARETLKIPTAPAGGSVEPRRVSKGILPDPALLDGSAHQADKKNEYGMLGEFEMPGDENVRSGKVGPQPTTPPPPNGGGLQIKSPLPAGLPAGGMPAGQSGGPPGGGPMSTANAAGGGGGALPDSAAQAGGAAGDASAAGAAGGGGAGDAAGSPDPTGAAIGDPNLKIAGANPAGQGSRGGGAMDPKAKNAKPGAVMIGDPSLRLPNSPAAAEVVGRVNAGGAQQAMEKPVGQAAKSTTGDNSNRGAERGRPMPTGL